MKLETLRYALTDGIASITFDEENSPVNTMCLQWQDDLQTVTNQVVKDKDAIRGIVLASAKKTFFAGADLKGVMRMTGADAPKVDGTGFSRANSICASLRAFISAKFGT